MASRYWVGGSGTWDASSTANWSTTSGGAAGASAPVAADTALFDANSGTGTCTTAAGAVCTTVTKTSSTVGITLGADLTIAGAFTLTNGDLSLGSNTLTCRNFSSSNSNARSVDFGTGNITVTGNGLTVYNLTDGTNMTFSGTPVVNATYSGSTGTRAFNGPSTSPSETNIANINVSAGSDIVAFGTAPRASINVDFTGFTGTCTELPKLLYGGLTLSSGMTLGATTGSTIRFVSTSGTKTITTAGKTIDNPIEFDGIGGTWAFADALTQGSTRAFTITNGTVALKNGVTSTVGAFATSGTNQKYLQSTLAGSQATLSQASGTVSVSYLTIEDINAAGGATWEAFTTNNNVDAGNNLGWDFSFQTGKYMYTVRKNKRILP